MLSKSLLLQVKALVLAQTIEASKKPLLVLTGAGIEEFKLYNDLPYFSKYPIVELASWEMLPSENIAPSPDIVGARFKALQPSRNKRALYRFEHAAGRTAKGFSPK